MFTGILCEASKRCQRIATTERRTGNQKSIVEEARGGRRGMYEKVQGDQREMVEYSRVQRSVRHTRGNGSTKFQMYGNYDEERRCHRGIAARAGKRRSQVR